VAARALAGGLSSFRSRFPTFCTEFLIKRSLLPACSQRCHSSFLLSRHFRRVGHSTGVLSTLLPYSYSASFLFVNSTFQVGPNVPFLSVACIAALLIIRRLPCVHLLVICLGCFTPLLGCIQGHPRLFSLFLRGTVCLRLAFFLGPFAFASGTSRPRFFASEPCS